MRKGHQEGRAHHDDLQKPSTTPSTILSFLGSSMHVLDELLMRKLLRQSKDQLGCSLSSIFYCTLLPRQHSRQPHLLTFPPVRGYVRRRDVGGVYLLASLLPERPLRQAPCDSRPCPCFGNHVPRSTGGRRRTCGSCQPRWGSIARFDVLRGARFGAGGGRGWSKARFSSLQCT